MKIDVLGVEYSIEFSNEQADSMLKDCDGYCDESVKKIVVNDYSTGCELKNPEAIVKLNIRHEIIHTFFFESGLGADWEHPKFGQEETVVDWIARQFPKLLKAFEAADAL